MPEFLREFALDINILTVMFKRTAFHFPISPIESISKLSTSLLKLSPSNYANSLFLCLVRVSK